MSRIAVRRTSQLALAVLLLAGLAIPASAAPTGRFQPGEGVALRGLASSDSSFTSLLLVNWAPVASRCSLALEGPDGARLAPERSLTLEPLASAPFVDLFDGREAMAAQARISCDQSFSAYALVAGRQTGEVESAPLAARLEPSVVAAKDAPECPAGALCFDAPGVVHVPEPAQPVGRVSFPAPAGTFSRLRATLDVTVADWFPAQPSGKHLIYWFVINKNLDMPGLLYFRGPGKDEAFARHGIRLTHPEKIKVIKPFAAQVGHTYHIDNDYNMAKRTYRVTITDAETGEVKVVLASTPNVRSYTMKRNSNFLFDMGFPLPYAEPTEVPSFFWTYANVHIEAYK